MILKNEQLSIYIQNELNHLTDVVRLAEQRMISAQKNSNGSPAFIESAALHLQSFYTAVEQLFSRIAENINGSVQESETWHVDLLRQMTYEIPGIRPPILRKGTHDLLDELRAFRHRVRNLYTYQLNPERVRDLVHSLPFTFKSLSEDLEVFLQFLKAIKNE
jgi:hypothetical protein